MCSSNSCSNMDKAKEIQDATWTTAVKPDNNISSQVNMNTVLFNLQVINYFCVYTGIILCILIQI